MKHREARGGIVRRSERSRGMGSADAEVALGTSADADC